MNVGSFTCLFSLCIFIFLCHILVSISLRLIFFVLEAKLYAYYTVLSLVYLIEESVYRYCPTILGLHSECVRMYRPYRPFVIGNLRVS